MTDPSSARPEGFERISTLLAERCHPHRPVFLDVAARTANEAADALGVEVGQIAKSVVFRRRLDAAAVLVVTSGDRRVDEAKVAALVGALGRADADFVKARTGFSIGGVAPLGHATAPVALIDRELFRFADIWAAAGHPRGVFRLSPDALVTLTGAPVHDVVQAVIGQASRVADAPVAASPCTGVCRIDPLSGWCAGCQRTIEEIAAWSTLDHRERQLIQHRLERRRAGVDGAGSGVGSGVGSGAG